MRRRYHTHSMMVEVDLADIEDDDLIDELQQRGQSIPTAVLEPAIWEQLRVAFYTKNNEAAMGIAKRLCEIATGRVLP